jgi:hypothetical protein
LSGGKAAAVQGLKHNFTEPIKISKSKMKKIIISGTLAMLTLLFASGFIVKHSTGMVGYTGSPGEPVCSACHGGGSSPSKGMTITATPGFSLNQYLPDTVYKLSVIVAATNFSNFGFDCEILDSVNVNAGIMSSNLAAGIKTLTINNRRNATHTTTRFGPNGTAFTFTWAAPSEGKVIIYATANAVNLNGNTGGDLPMAQSLVLRPKPAPVNTVVVIDGIQESQPETVTKVLMYPNPSSGFTNLSYTLKQEKKIEVALLDIKGTVVKQLLASERERGDHSEILYLDDVAAGVYFIRISADGEKVSQKLISVH